MCGMLQTRRDANLAKQRFRADRRRDAWLQNLHCNTPLVPNVFREVHGRHAADAEHTLDDIAAIRQARARHERIEAGRLGMRRVG